MIDAIVTLELCVTAIAVSALAFTHRVLEREEEILSDDAYAVARATLERRRKEFRDYGDAWARTRDAKDTTPEQRAACLGSLRLCEAEVDKIDRELLELAKRRR